MAQTIAITGGHVVPIEGDPVDGGTVLLRDGKIAAVEGPGFAVPDGAEVVDATGKWVLPGFIDAHAHAGLAEESEGWAGQDTNERTDPVSPQLRALDGINPADLGLKDAIGGGVLAVNVNPGSANPIGGQTVAIKCWGRTVDEMVLREPAGLKSALGENPKRVYGERHETPFDPARHRRGDPRRVRRGPELPGQAGRGRIRAGGQGPQARGAGPGAAPGDPVAAALPPGRRHRDGDADGQGVRLRPGHRPRYRGVPAGRPDRRRVHPGDHRPAVHQPVQGRTAQPVAGQPGPGWPRPG